MNPEATLRKMRKLAAEWENLKHSLYQTEWLARRAVLLQKRTLTRVESIDLEMYNSMVDDLPTGSIADQSLNARFRNAVELLEKAAASQKGGR